MKKLAAFCIGMVITLCMAFGMTGSVFAAEAVGSIKYSEIVSYINHYPIPSYNYNGNTMIIVETLDTYGFSLPFNEYEKSKCIIRNQINEILPRATFQPRADQLGTEYKTLYQSNVKLYLGDHEKEIPCYEDGAGYLYMNISDLGYFGKYDWVPETKAAKVWISDGLEMYPSMPTLRPDPYPIWLYSECIKDDKAIMNSFTNANGDVNIIVSFLSSNGINYCKPVGYASITLLDSNGVTIYTGTRSFSSDGFSVLPYFYNLSNLPCSNMLDKISSSDITPTKDGKGLLKITLHSGVYQWKLEQYLQGLPTN